MTARLAFRFALRLADCVLVLVLVLVTFTGLAAAPDRRLSVLVLREREHGDYDVRFERTQGIHDVQAALLLLRPSFPPHCRFSPPRLACGTRGLSGRIGFSGLGELGGSALIRIERKSGRVESHAFSAARPQLELGGDAVAPGALAIALGFVPVGVEHIVLGFDHLAFVLGLLWLVRERRALLWTITAFTLGHSVTLSVAALGFASVPSLPVEACIALSIAFVALELIRRERGQATPSARSAYMLAACFGLLHGFGFATALSELELEPARLPAALVGFNLGVELGQVAFIACVLLLERATPAVLRVRLERLRPAAQYALGGLAMYWFFDRVVQLAEGV